MPGLARVAMIFNPKTAAGGGSYFSGPFKAAASSLAVEPIELPVSDPTGLENAVVTLSREPHAGLIVMPDSFTVNHRALIISMTAQHRLPVVYCYRYMATEGGLMSYGIDLNDMYKRAAPYVDRILKGDKPADLPVQAHQIRIRHQSQDRQGARSRHAATLLGSADE